MRCRLAGLFRHHLAGSDGVPRIAALLPVNGGQQQQPLPPIAQPQQRPESTTQNPQHQNSTNSSPSEANGDYDPVDYRCYNSSSKMEEVALTFSISILH